MHARRHRPGGVLLAGFAYWRRGAAYVLAGWLALHAVNFLLALGLEDAGAYELRAEEFLVAAGFAYVGNAVRAGAVLHRPRAAPNRALVYAATVLAALPVLVPLDSRLGLCMAAAFIIAAAALYVVAARLRRHAVAAGVAITPEGWLAFVAVVVTAVALVGYADDLYRSLTALAALLQLGADAFGFEVDRDMLIAELAFVALLALAYLIAAAVALYGATRTVPKVARDVRGLLSTLTAAQPATR